MANIPVKVKRRISGGDYQSLGQNYVVYYIPNGELFSPSYNSGLSTGFYLGSVEDIPNAVFETIQDGFDYTDQQYFDVLLPILNGNTFDPNYGINTYVAGEITPIDYEVEQALALKADVSHTQAASTINSGTFDDARIAQSNVTQHQAALSITSSQVTGTKTSSFISDFAEASQDAVAGIMSGTSGVSVTYNDGSNTIVVSGNQPTVNDNVSRSLNSNYTISSNVRGVICNYSINASWTLNALLSGSGAAFLEYSVDSGSNWITVNNVGKGLNLLTFAGSDDMNLSGFIPSTATNTRIRTTATNMTITYTRGQEVLI